MEPFSERHETVPTGRRCDTCGLHLELPPIVAGEHGFCCRGCARAFDRGEGMALARPDARHVAVTRAVRIERPPDQVAVFLSDIELLHLYEQKLSRLQITALSEGGKRACATADGHFGLLTYHIELHFDAFEGGGYQSTLCDRGPIAALEGTFSVEPADRGCVVIHVEDYHFLGGALGHAMGRAYVPYIGWSMARELRTLKRLVEDPVALGEAVRIGDPRTIAIDPRVRVWDPTRDRPARRAWLSRVPTPTTVAIASAFVAGALTGAGTMRYRR
jgi:hypothetical protein